MIKLASDYVGSPAIFCSACQISQYNWYSHFSDPIWFQGRSLSHPLLNWLVNKSNWTFHWNHWCTSNCLFLHHYGRVLQWCFWTSSRTFWSKPPLWPHTRIKQQHEITARAPQWRLCFHWELPSQRLPHSVLTPTAAHKHTPLWHWLSTATSKSNKVLGVAAASSHPSRKWCKLGSRLNSGFSLRALLWRLLMVRCQVLPGLVKTCFRLWSLGQAEQVGGRVRVGQLDESIGDQQWAHSITSGNSLVDCLVNERTVSVFQSNF